MRLTPQYLLLALLSARAVVSIGLATDNEEFDARAVGGAFSFDGESAVRGFDGQEALEDLSARDLYDAEEDLFSRDFDDEDSLLGRDFDFGDVEELASRDEEEEVLGREFNVDELAEQIARDFIEDDELFGREVGLSEEALDVLGREFDEEDLFGRDLDDAVEQFMREMSENEDLFGRDVDDEDLLSRELEVDQVEDVSAREEVEVEARTASATSSAAAAPTASAGTTSTKPPTSLFFDKSRFSCNSIEKLMITYNKTRLSYKLWSARHKRARGAKNSKKEALAKTKMAERKEYMKRIVGALLRQGRPSRKSAAARKDALLALRKKKN
ncbi:hypothetical protein FA15DRAFT_671740 [Coprinopsis marcescibilis]|uniref:Uncharacterized protein n=1 Tax=Coprinopsis marcescibilis TaxID=230819 RepID=A0A5C3KP77_COPMA|nr:hypothetical protein FA15DRAFT_671740 [Coprinopsis marcescibilis]